MNRPQVSPPILIDGAQSRDAANVGVMAASLPPLRVVVDPERLLDIADIDPARIGMASPALPPESFPCAVDLDVLEKQLNLHFVDHLIAELEWVLLLAAAERQEQSFKIEKARLTEPDVLQFMDQLGGPLALHESLDL